MPATGAEADATSRTTAGRRVYAIGDIHGRLDLLLRLEARIQADAGRHAMPDTVVVFLGDYVDRGWDSRGVLDHLSHTPPIPGRCVHLMGNHEEMLLRFLDDPGCGPLWLVNGGRETLASYHVPAPLAAMRGDGGALRETRDAFAEALPAAHRAFLEGLEMTHIEGDYLFVHAGLRPGVPLRQQRREDLLWMREPFLSSDADFGHIVVHGHTPSRGAQVRRNRIGVDTGAFATGTLTAAVLDGESVAFLTAEAGA